MRRTTTLLFCFLYLAASLPGIIGGRTSAAAPDGCVMASCCCPSARQDAGTCCCSTQEEDGESSVSFGLSWAACASASEEASDVGPASMYRHLPLLAGFTFQPSLSDTLTAGEPPAVLDSHDFLPDPVPIS